MIFIDLKTSGDNSIEHGIVSIGAMEFEDPHRNFYAEPLLGPKKEVLTVALEANGFKEWQIRDSSRPSLRKVLSNFEKWYKRCQNISLAGHNIGQFDYLFLRQAFKEIGKDWPFGMGVVDLRSNYVGYCMNHGIKIPVEKKRLKAHLDDVLEFVGLPRREGTHNALNDARLTAEAYSRLVYGANLIKEYSEYDIPDRFVNLG